MDLIKSKMENIFEMIKQIVVIAFHEWMHFFWLFFVIIFCFINIWSIFLSRTIGESIKLIRSNLDLYSILIGMLAPELFGLLLKIYFEKKKSGNTHFIKVKFILVLLGFPFLFILYILENGFYNKVIWLQIVVAVIIVFYTFFCYLSSFLDPENNKEIDDNYEIEEKKEQNLLSEESKKIKFAKTKGIKFQV